MNGSDSHASGTPLPTRHFFRLLLWVHWRTFVARVRGLRKQSSLLLFVLGGFIAGYLGFGYWLFHFGFNYIQQFPLVGALLSERILFLIFGFFFVMLIFSNLIIGYSTLFKNRETSWFLTLPIPHRTVYRWKFVEALAVSSWALMFLSAPMMAAYGVLHHVHPLFYVGTLLSYLPFVIMPALAGSWIILFLVRILAKPWVKKTIVLVAIFAIAALVITVKPVTDEQAVARHEDQMFDQLLRHTRLSLNPFLPSSWLAQSIIAWGEGLFRQGAFFFLVLLSNALMGLLLGFEVVGRSFYLSWTAAVSSRAEQMQRKAEEKRIARLRLSPVEWFMNQLMFISRPTRALTLKDMRLFWRDPAQWTQFMIFFGLLCIYVLNLRNISFNFQSRFWETMISYLNLTASALTLSTLTTRFVFPQFSLEGRRLWIIGLAPIGLKKVLMQKFWTSCIVSMSITVSLMVVSSRMLHLPPGRVVFFAVSIAVMGTALSGLSVGLGALFPNLKEDNPSKIVSGFGGTLCLVLSFIYIACFVALVALPGVRLVVPLRSPLSDTAALVIAVVLSGCFLFIPMAAAIHRVKIWSFEPGRLQYVKTNERLMAERAKQKESLLELPEDELNSTEHLDSQVQKAQEQLLQLKRQQELIEKQKRELEELSKRQEQLQQGKAEMTEKFTRALVVLERETYDAQKRVEQLKSIHEAFSQHLGLIEAINPKNWENTDINKELNKALSAVDDARAEYAQSRSRINAESSQEVLEPANPGGDPYAAGYVDAGEKDFVYWLKSGFAFTLPLFVLGVIILLVLLFRGS